MRQDKYSSKMSRREILTALGVGAGVGIGIGTGIVILKNHSTPSRPSFPRAASTGKTHDFTFEAAPVQLSLNGKQISTWAYNGVLPGPEIRVTEGDTIKVTVKNRLPQETSIHWHGVPLVNTMDGVPDLTQKAIPSQQDFIYTFQAPTAGTFFYHSHVGLQLDRGLYGPLIIEAKKEQKNYDHDFVLILDDWLDSLRGTPDDAMKQLLVSGDKMAGMQGMGNAMMQVPPDITYPMYLINGHTSEQPLELEIAQGQRARIRLINASASTIYHIALQGHQMTITHTDGQPVEPVQVDTLRLGMGERYDVLVTANNPGVWQLAAKVEGALPMVRAILRYKGSAAPLPPVTFQPAELQGKALTYSILKAAPGLFVPPTDTPDITLPIRLSGGMGTYIWKINEQVFSMKDPIAVERQRLVQFQFENKSMMPHPMHLHGHFFQVDNGTGRGPLKDTVLVDPMQTVTVNWISDNPGSWAFHCHNAYHQAGGMMSVVKVGS